MPHRPVIAVSPEEARRIASAVIACAHLFDVGADRPKRIDQWLDYFGEGDLATRRGPRIGLRLAVPRGTRFG